eukprot:COSAG06_NODE_192_length_20674_cov_7.209186_2_plen_262_part_00
MYRVYQVVHCILPGDHGHARVRLGLTHACARRFARGVAPRSLADTRSSGTPAGGAVTRPSSALLITRLDHQQLHSCAKMSAPSELALDASAVASCQKRWLPSAPTGTPPAPRCSHTATQLAGGQKHKFLVVGGGSCTDGDWTHYGDVHQFDAHAQAWTELVPVESSPVLPPRRGHCAGVYAKSGLLYVFGGTSGGTGLSELRNDFWRMRLADTVWEKLPTTGTTPPARRGGMSALSESRGQMWVFGGYVAKRKQITNQTAG